MNKKAMFILSILTFGGITLYWLLVFMGIFPVEELVPGYTQWFMSFPPADFWIAANALLTAVAISRKNFDKAAVTGLLTASGLIFLGLYAFTYGFTTGLIFNITVDEVIEIAIKIYCLTVGSYFIKNCAAALRRKQV